MNLDLIQKEFTELQNKHFNLVNSYITGKVDKADYKDFTVSLFSLRKKLDEYKPKEDEILTIAQMKSRIQHFITDSVEDEEILKSMFS